MPHYRPALQPDRPLVADWPSALHYPAMPHCLSVRDRPPVPDQPSAAALGYRAVVHRMAGLVPRRRAAHKAGRRAAVLGYLTAPVFGAPVVIPGPRPRGRAWRGVRLPRLAVHAAGPLKAGPAPIA
jgi:hypothetical protein